MFTDRFSHDDPCRETSGELSAVMDDNVLDEAARNHVASCLRCQAELARYRRLARLTHQLVGRGSAPPDDLERRILHLLDREDAGDLRRNPGRTAATIGGLAAAAGVIVLATRQRRFARLAG